MMYIHNVRCAAFPNGCQSFLIWEDNVSDKTQVSDVGRRLLELNNWQNQHGRWVCWQHTSARDERT